MKKEAKKINQIPLHQINITEKKYANILYHYYIMTNKVKTELENIQTEIRSESFKEIFR
jgi:hypothetical protein